MILGQAKCGTELKVNRLCGGRRQQGRLCSMGVYPGANITLLDGDENGSCKISVKGSVMTLCPNMQQHIEVEYADACQNCEHTDCSVLETVEV